MLNKYPKTPTNYTLEIELTNHCNAKCIFCSNHSSTREKGFVDTEKLICFLNEQRKQLPDNWFNQKIGENIFPKIVLAGLGEPLLHKDAFKIIKTCKEYGFRVQLVTNGLLLTNYNISQLIESEIDEISISLHSINSEIYHSITNLELDKVFPRVKNALEKFANTKIKIELWRIMPPMNMKRESLEDQNNYSKFVNDYPFVKVLGPSEPWERDGIVDSQCESVNDDPNGKIWCHKIFFTHNIAWNGDIVICCNDFKRVSVNLGNAFDSNLIDSNKVKQEILSKRIISELCSKCKRWKDLEYEQIISEYNIQI